MNFLAIVWDVHPELIQITDSYAIRWYGVLFALGYLISYYVLQKHVKYQGIDGVTLEKITLAAIIGGVVGARLGHCIFYQPLLYLDDPIKILYVWEGGLASHGGAIGILVGFWITSIRTKLSFWTILSQAMLVVPLAGFFIRIGNLMNSEIYGIPTDLPWGIIYKQSAEVQYGIEAAVPRHPTQLYEAFAYLLTFIILQIYARRVYKSGRIISEYFVMGIFLIGIFFSRFMIEFVKNPQVSFEKNMNLDMGQWLSLPFILFGIYSLIKSYKASRILG